MVHCLEKLNYEEGLEVMDLQHSVAYRRLTGDATDLYKIFEKHLQSRYVKYAATSQTDVITNKRTLFKDLLLHRNCNTTTMMMIIDDDDNEYDSLPQHITSV